jgi:diguanylate cyclase (GGDEF)-like protein
MARRFMELPWGRPASGCPDTLTGVLLRQDVVQRLEDELSRARREHQELGIGILHVDGLARVNECCGLSAGDAVLREVVRRARSELRPYDVVGRLGGDEFLVILSRTSEPDLPGVLHRLRAAVSAQPFSHDGADLEVTVTLGGATGEVESAGELIDRAQRSLDEAQTAGPDRVAVGCPAVLEAVLARE